MKNLLAALLFLVLLGAGGVITYRLLNPERDAAQTAVDAFMELLRAGELYDAYRSAAAMVRSRSFEAFESGLINGGLVGWKSANWNSITVASTESRFQGLITSAGGDSLPVTINLVREAGNWKVFSVVSERSGSLLQGDVLLRATDPEAVSTDILPSEDEAKALAYQTILKFNEAIQINNFGPFYEQVSNAWKQQTTAAKLAEAFQVFVESGVSFGNIQKDQAELTVAPAVTSEGLLDVRGMFPSNDLEIGFELKYIQERGQWRLFAINVNLRRKS